MTENRAPLVSVVMPVYNGEKYLAEAIESILTQTFADFEFVIVDDGSQDGSAAIIQDYARRDGRIHFIQLERNCGQASALNRGTAEARGVYIALMDCDDISLPERLEKQTDFLAANPDIGVVGLWIQVVNQDLTPRKTWDYPLRHVDIVLDLCLRDKVLGGATVMMRRDAVISVGGYDPQRLVNDKDLFTRLVGVTRFASLPQRLYWFRRHERNMTVILRQRVKGEWSDIHARWLDRLCSGDAEALAERLARLGRGEKFGWAERRTLRRDLDRLIEALFAANGINEADKAQLEANFARCLESTTPRRWQMFLHWRRHHFGSEKSEKAD